MQKNAVGTVNYTLSLFDPDPGLAKYRFELLNSSNAVVATQDFGTNVGTVTFLAVTPGTGYKVRASQLTAADVLIGTQVLSNVFDVTGVVVLVVGSIAVTVVSA